MSEGKIHFLKSKANVKLLQTDSMLFKKKYRMPHEVVRAKHFTSPLKAEAGEGVPVDTGGTEVTVVTALQVSASAHALTFPLYHEGATPQVNHSAVTGSSVHTDVDVHKTF